MNLTWTIDWNNTVSTLNESEANSFATLMTASYSKASQKVTLAEAQIPGLSFLVFRLLPHLCTTSHPPFHHSINQSINQSFPCLHLLTPILTRASPPCLLFMTDFLPTPPLVVGTYIINLLATNWLGLNATATKTIEKSTQNLPTVSIVSQNPRTVSVWSAVELSAVVSPPSCLGSSSLISLEWGVFEVDPSEFARRHFPTTFCDACASR